MSGIYNILHLCVNVNDFYKGGINLVAKFTNFGKTIKKALIDLDKNEVWLIEQVKERTNLYFDNSYLYKIKTGQHSTPSIVTAICEILQIDFCKDAIQSD